MSCAWVTFERKGNEKGKVNSHFHPSSGADMNRGTGSSNFVEFMLETLAVRVPLRVMRYVHGDTGRQWAV